MSIEFKKYKYEDKIAKHEKLKRLIWQIVEFLFFKSNPAWLLNSWRVFLLRLFGAKIGYGCIVYPSCKIWAPWNLEMGDYSVLAAGVDCYCVDKILIGSKVAVSQRAFICTASHHIDDFKRPLTHRPIFLKDHVWIAAEAFIGPGVTIHEGGVVGARGVVVKDVPEWSVVAGNPAKFIKKRIINEEMK